MKNILKKTFVIIITFIYLFSQINSVRALDSSNIDFSIEPSITNPNPTPTSDPAPTLIPAQIPTPTLEITG